MPSAGSTPRAERRGRQRADPSRPVAGAAIHASNVPLLLIAAT